MIRHHPDDSLLLAHAGGTLGTGPALLLDAHLDGALDDGRAVFRPGDFDEADQDILHRPVVQAQGECLCLAAVDGHLVFESWIARLASMVVGF